MSGSPVYVDGKLLGALSYRIGQFSKEPIAGITPIAEMLGGQRHARQPSIQPVDAWRHPDNPAGRAASARPPLAVADVTDIHPIETPLLLSGFSPEAVRFFQEHVSRHGTYPGCRDWRQLLRRRAYGFLFSATARIGSERPAGPGRS